MTIAVIKRARGAVIKSGVNSAEVRRQADRAETAAVAAEVAAGPTYANTTAGLAATSSGEAFAVDNGDGTVTVYLNDGGSAVSQRTLATTDYLASTAGGGAVGLLDGGTVQDHFNSDGDLLFTFGAIGDPSGASQNILIRNVSAGATRIHQEPNGYIDSGTVTKYDWMFDPYDEDGVNYRIFNLTTSVGDVNGTGESGIAYMGAKNTGNHFGLWSSIHFGFSDDSENGVPLKLHYVDHTQSQHFTPATGAWRSGKSYTTGDYSTTLQGGVGRIYVAASPGTAGATVPSHASGTVSDGGVDWTFVHAVSSPDVRPVVLIGNRDDMPKLGNSNARLQLAADGIVWNGVFLNFLDSSDAEAWEIGTQGLTDDFYIRSASGGFIRFDKTGKFAQWSGLSDLTVNITAANGDTTPSIDGTRGLLLNNSSATTITQFDDGKGGQVFYIEAANGNTTLQHGTNLRLFGEKNRTLAAGEMLAFRCNSNGQSARQISPMAQAAAVADLNQTISATPTQSEVQAISDKLDDLLASLRGNGVLDT